MRRTEELQEVRKMRFLEVYADWNEKRLSQFEVGLLLGDERAEFSSLCVAL
jgi:hypothetical protein